MFFFISAKAVDIAAMLGWSSVLALVYYWHSMEQDIALQEFAPNKEARALPHFYGCSGEGCEE